MRQLGIAKKSALEKKDWPEPKNMSQVAIYHCGRKEALEDLANKFPRWAEPKKERRGVRAIFSDIQLLTEELREIADELESAASRTRRAVFYRDLADMIRMRALDTDEEIENFEYNHR
jgi:hypothetical protein|tara:strand:- start:730 stop:1083 length:354 start_codon:yes stop_codon:yes gene_type:complete